MVTINWFIYPIPNMVIDSTYLMYVYIKIIHKRSAGYASINAHEYSLYQYDC